MKNQKLWMVAGLALLAACAKKDSVTDVTPVDPPHTTNRAMVLDYQPAPGQFINQSPEWVAGNTDQDLIVKAQTSLDNNNFVCLGGYGGYIVLGMQYAIPNVDDQYSFLVKGNAFTNWAEPGIILVSADANNNGKPDDEWYEIAGSEYNSPKTIRNYQITYFKPDEKKVATPSKTDNTLSDTTYIRWKDNQGKSGYLSKNTYHTQSYYPQWKGDSITFSGSLLSADGVKDLSGSGVNWVSPALSFGYADNWANDNDNAKIKISWAVDKSGKKVNLKNIKFIKVYTGMRAEAGWLGEVSTEVTGVTDLTLKQ